MCAPDLARRALLTAYLLIAHGSWQPEANDDLRHVASEMERRGHAVVESCFLEAAEPGIDEGGSRCVGRGAQRVIMIPYFLSAGVHVRRDLAAARDRLAGQFAPVEFRLADALGRHPLLIDVVVDRARQALER
jgi:sirohydrochlorin ferrochelatase